MTEPVNNIAPEKVLNRLRQNFGEDRVRVTTGAEYRVGAEESRIVAVPQTQEELGEMLRLAGAESWRVIPAGAGSWLEMGNPPTGFDLLISTSRLGRLLDYEPADLTATLEAGHPLTSFNAIAGQHGQWIPLDPFGSPDSTIGATIATASHGPLRGGFGTPRDWLIGIRVAQVDGRMTRAGGKVVKNVAGYDLCKLYTGSFGTLAIITEMTFKLRSRPPVDRTIMIQANGQAPGQATEANKAESLARLAAITGEIRQSALQPVAIEIVTPQSVVPLPIEPENPNLPSLVVRFSHEAEAVDSQIAETIKICGNVSKIDQTVLSEADAALFWKSYHDGETDQRWETSLRLSFLPADLPEILALASSRFPAAHQRAHAANGTLRLHFVAGTGPKAGELSDFRQALEARDGRQRGQMIILRAPAHLDSRIDTWGDPGPTAHLMQSIKQQYDPQQLLNPGRFVAGI